MRRRPPLALLVLVAASVAAEPCFMASPVTEPRPGVVDPVLVRRGVQRTYVFHLGRVEDIVVQPSLAGGAEHFGMILPFPEAPVIRKVEGTFFDDLDRLLAPDRPGPAIDHLEMEAPEAGPDGVRVLREEVVGIYKAATLEAGSAAALIDWLDGNGYNHPPAMDAIAQEYVERGWVFVAVKVELTAHAGVDPVPGGREVEPGLPAGARVSGPIQAMGFRFHSEHLVLSARLASLNDRSQMTSRLYLLTDRAIRLAPLDDAFVREHVSGKLLFDRARWPGSALQHLLADIAAADGETLEPTGPADRGRLGDLVLTIVEGRLPADVLRESDLVAVARAVEPGIEVAPDARPDRPSRRPIWPIVFGVVLIALVLAGSLTLALRESGR